MASLPPFNASEEIDLIVKLTQVKPTTDENDPLAIRTLKFTKIGEEQMLGRSSSTIQKKLIPAPDNAWIACPVISRVHAKMTTKPSPFGAEVVLQDNNSSHGTYVNDTQLISEQAHLLRDGDRIRLGVEIVQDKSTYKPPEYLVTINRNSISLSPDTTVQPSSVASFKEIEAEVDDVDDEYLARRNLSFGYSDSDMELSAASSEYSESSDGDSEEESEDMEEAQKDDHAPPLVEAEEGSDWEYEADVHIPIPVFEAFEASLVCDFPKVVDHGYHSPAPPATPQVAKPTAPVVSSAIKSSTQPSVFVDLTTEDAEEASQHCSSPVFRLQSPTLDRYADGPFAYKSKVPCTWRVAVEAKSQPASNQTDEALNLCTKARNEITIHSLINEQDVVPTASRPNIANMPAPTLAEITPPISRPTTTSPLTVGKPTTTNSPSTIGKPLTTTDNTSTKRSWESAFSTALPEFYRGMGDEHAANEGWGPGFVDADEYDFLHESGGFPLLIPREGQRFASATTEARAVDRTAEQQQPVAVTTATSTNTGCRNAALGPVPIPFVPSSNSLAQREPPRPKKKARLSSFLAGVAVGAVGGGFAVLGGLVALPEGFFL